MGASMHWEKRFSQIADEAALFLGKPLVFVSVFALTIAWVATGPLVGWSDTWQVVGNTTTNIVTFLMVFVIQDSQNRDSAALQTKLDEILRAVAPNSHLTGIEDLTQDEIEEIKARRNRN